VLALIFSFLIASNQAQGLNLNPALLGCIVSGGACLDEVPFLKEMLSRDPLPQGHCTSYYDSDEYWAKNGYHECMTAKQAFLIKKRWPNFKDQGHNRAEKMDIERQLNDLQRAGFVERSTCNEKQRKAFVNLKIRTQC
jgi:hypothetical protein